MTNLRTARSKGSAFEYDCAYSLLPRYADIEVTQKTGFVQGYDLISKEKRIVFECKRHALFSWNKLEKVIVNLRKKAPKGYASLVLFQSNRQPCLVFTGSTMWTFDEYFGIPYRQRPKGYAKSLNG